MYEYRYIWEKPLLKIKLARALELYCSVGVLVVNMHAMIARGQENLVLILSFFPPLTYLYSGTERRMLVYELLEYFPPVASLQPMPLLHRLPDQATLLWSMGPLLPSMNMAHIRCIFCTFDYQVQILVPVSLASLKVFFYGNPANIVLFRLVMKWNILVAFVFHTEHLLIIYPLNFPQSSKCEKGDIYVSTGP